MWHDAWLRAIRSQFILLTANVTFIYFINMFEGAGEQIAAESNRRQGRNKRRLEIITKLIALLFTLFAIIAIKAERIISAGRLSRDEK